MAETRRKPLTESERWEDLKRAALRIQLELDYTLLDLKDDDEESYLAIQNSMTLAYGKMHRAIAGAGLVRPFNWTEWKVPNPTLDEIPFLSEEDTWKFLTRIVRSDRFMEGNFDAACRAGHVPALALRAYHHAMLDDEGWPKALPVSEDGYFETGLQCVAKARLVRGKAGRKRTACPDPSCPGWLVSMTWVRFPKRLVCSTRWHYDPDTKSLRIVGGGMTSGLSHAQIEERKES